MFLLLRNKLVLLASIFIISCGSTNEIVDIESTDKIIYRFGDSSVPPPYHRSYEIVANKSTINIVVDSYGDIISEKSIELRSENFTDILQTIKKAEISPQKERNSIGCTGGTSDYLDLFNGDQNIFSGFVYNCGGEKFGNMKGDITIVKTKLKSLIPDFLSLLE